MTEYRKAQPGELEACIELANYVFSTAHAPHDFEQLIPKVYQAGEEMAPLHRVAVDEKGRFRSLIAVLPETLQIGKKTLRVGYVGSVAVHPKARGEGHMKRILQDWIEELEGSCDMLALDGQRQRYAYFGFTQGSMRYVFSVEEPNVRHALKHAHTEKYTFSPLFAPEHREEGIRYAKERNEARPCYVVREESQIEAVMATYCAETLGVYREGTLVGYLLLGGKSTVAESAFTHEEDRAEALAAYMKWRNLSGLEISVPVYDRSQIRCLSALAENCRLERCGSGMYRIYDFANVLEAYLTLKAETMGLASGSFSAVMEGQPVTVSVEDGNVSVSRTAQPDALVLNRQQAQELLLSFHAADGGRAGIPEELYRKIPSGWFPLPIYWGMADEF